MKVNPAVFRAYDIRGKVGEDLTPALVELVGCGFGSYIKSRGGQQVSVSRDNRESSRGLASDFIRGVLSTGVNVVDLGLTTTPMLYFSIIYWDLDGGAMITGSHNHPDYNGVKLCRKQALHIFGEELQEIRKLVETNNFVSGRGRLEKNDIFDEYEGEILRRVKLNAQARHSIKVVVDCGDGVAGPFAPEIFEKLGCQVFHYACRPLADFPHGGADPSVPENLEDLAEIVTTRGYGLGVGLDPDGDRLGVVDEKGDYVPIEKIAFLLAKDILHGKWSDKFTCYLNKLNTQARHSKKKFVCDVRCLLGFKTAVEKMGGAVEMIPTGRSFFRQKLYEDPNVLLGVEASGHLHINDNFYGFDDGIFAAARLLQVLSKSHKSLSALVADFPPSFYTPEIQLPYPDEKKFELVEKVKKVFSQKYDTIEVDGVRAKLDEKSWFLVRAKNTGPYLSLRFEADTKEKVLEMIGVVAEELKKYPGIDESWEGQARRWAA